MGTTVRGLIPMAAHRFLEEVQSGNSHQTDIVHVFQDLEATGSDALERFADFYYTGVPVVRFLASYVESPAELYRVLFVAWDRALPPLRLEALRVPAGWLLRARVVTDDADASVLFRVVTQLLRRVPQNLGPAPVVRVERMDARTAIWQVELTGSAARERDPEEILAAIHHELDDALPAPNRIRPEWGLTSAESRVVHLLARGRSIPEIATVLRIARETARTHVKRAMSKAHVSRQIELVIQVLSPSAVR